MGIIATALIAVEQIDSADTMPGWVPLTCFEAIGLGTMMGGWRIVKTMGTKITKVTALVCAETAGALNQYEWIEYPSISVQQIFITGLFN